jgi:hypothetical protein
MDHSVTRAVILVLALSAVPHTASPQQTERLYQEACDSGDLLACNVFGVMLEIGDGVPQDVARAVELYQRACEGGELIGCTNLGVMYETGLAVAQDLALARGLYRTACEGGEQLGCSLRERVGQRAIPESTTRHFKSGQVGDAETLETLGNAVVTLIDLELRTISDANGSFAFAGLPAGLHRLRVERLGYETVDGQVLVPGNPEFFVLLTPAALDDPDAPGSLVGRVIEAPDQGLGAVDVTIVGEDIVRALTNAQGRFTLGGLRPGLAVVRFSRLGYAPRTATVVVQPGRTVEVSATLAVQPFELAAIEVAVRSATLERRGFYQRSERGIGTQLSPSRLERTGAMLVSEALTGRIPGVSVAMSGGSTRLVSRRGVDSTLQECALAVFLDGIQLGDTDLDLFPVDALEAIEVYQGVETPAQYVVNPCGAVLLWTRQS